MSSPATADNDLALSAITAHADTLSDVLRNVRLHGAVFYYVSCRDDWSAEALPAKDIAKAVLPAAEHVMEYHVMAKGNGWAVLHGEQPVPLSPGDVVMFPQGDAHVLAKRPGLAPNRMSPDWMFATRHDAKPIPVSYHQGVEQPGALMPVEDADAVLVCGFIGCDRRPFNPLIAALPRILHHASDSNSAWVWALLRQAVRESQQHSPGGDALLARMSEMLFVDAVRRHLSTLPEESRGWLAGLRDRFVGRALALLHERPAAPWTIEELGRQVGLSRSALHERFVQFIGQPPMHYLTQWRLQLAAGLLRSTHATVANVAQDVGYDSEAAFARAFKRFVGHPPAAWRRRYR
jgi:AraC-like DNA-binding protein